jgi:hypothetical protein
VPLAGSLVAAPGWAPGPGAAVVRSAFSVTARPAFP